MYIVGQERRLVNPPSQVVAGVRTVTTKMNGRDTLPRCRAHSLLYSSLSLKSIANEPAIIDRIRSWQRTDFDLNGSVSVYCQQLQPSLALTDCAMSVGGFELDTGLTR